MGPRRRHLLGDGFIAFAGGPAAGGNPGEGR